MRWLLVALCACNQILGLGDVRDRSPPIDAPFACPPIGTTPVFSPLIHQSLQQDCLDYLRFSTGVELGLCRPAGESRGSYTISIGTGDAKLASIPELVPPFGVGLGQPRMTPDGMILIAVSYMSFTYTVQQWSHQGAGWSHDGNVPFPNPSSISLGTFARDPLGGWRMIVVGANIDEWTLVNGVWTKVATHTVDAPGLAVEYAGLAEDGLRMIVRASANTIDATYFTDRPDLETEFRPLARLDDVPPTRTPNMDAACGRIYLTGLESVFYAQQQ